MCELWEYFMSLSHLLFLYQQSWIESLPVPMIEWMTWTHWSRHSFDLRFFLQNRLRVLPSNHPQQVIVKFLISSFKKIPWTPSFGFITNKNLLCHTVGNLSKDHLHHCQMFPVVVCLEQCHAQVQLKHDATAEGGNILISKRSSSFSLHPHSPNRPHVTGLCPSQFQDHLGRSIMTSRDNCTVMLVIKGGAAKVNQTHVRALDPSHHPRLLAVQRGRVVGVNKQDVLRLQVRVRQVVVMHELAGVYQLVRNMPHVVHGIRLVVVFFLQVAKHN